MSKVCLKCGYERQGSDDFPEWGCPKCGAVYAKVKARSITPKQREPKYDSVNSAKKTKNCPFCGEEILAIAVKCKHCGSMLKATAPVASSRKKRTDSKREFFFSGGLSFKETLIVIFGLIAFFATYASLKEAGSLDKLWAQLISPLDSTSDSNYDFSYKKSSNQYGVVFYYFKPVNAPLVELTPASLEIKDISQINRILTTLKVSPVPQERAYDKSGKYLFVWRDYEGGKLVINVARCKKKRKDTDTYTCVDDLYISPSKKQMMINQATNSKTRVFVSREEYGDAWPLKLDYGIVACRRYSSVVFRSVDHKVYALNGAAMGDNGYKDVRKIWKEDPKLPGMKISLHPLIKKGLSLCEK